MKEKGNRILQKLCEIEAKQFEIQWRASKWSHIESFVEVGIKPKTKILSLWEDFGNNGERYDQYLIRSGFKYEERHKFWALMLRFQNDVGDSATIEDFQNLAVTDLEDLRSYDFTEIKILTRAFASSTK